MLSVTLLIAISLLLQLQDLLASLLASYAGEKMVLDFRARLVAHAQRLSFSYHDAKGSADSIYRIQTDAMALRAGIRAPKNSIRFSSFSSLTTVPLLGQKRGGSVFEEFLLPAVEHGRV